MLLITLVSFLHKIANLSSTKPRFPSSQLTIFKEYQNSNPLGCRIFLLIIQPFPVVFTCVTLNLQNKLAPLRRSSLVTVAKGHDTTFILARPLSTRNIYFTENNNRKNLKKSRGRQKEDTFIYGHNKKTRSKTSHKKQVGIIPTQKVSKQN